MRDWISVSRPRQWTKNLLVFAGLIFSDRFTEPDAIRLVFLTFFAFCFTSSAGYILNDLFDREHDRLHPQKKLRAIASGRLSAASAMTACVFFLAFGVACAMAANPHALWAIGIYALNQILYVFVARRIAILDVFVIGVGFVIRAMAGAWVLGVLISPWLLLCTLLLALFLGFAKRRHELRLLTESRASLAGYTLPLLDQLITVCAAAAVLAYSVYAIQSETALAHPYLALTIPLPMFGVFRYLQVSSKEDGGGSPDADLLRDPWLYGTVLVWIALSIVAMTL